MLDRGDNSEQLVQRYITKIKSVADNVNPALRRSSIYFEKWDDPMISAIRWVSELLEIAGGIGCLKELSQVYVPEKNRIIVED